MTERVRREALNGDDSALGACLRDDTRRGGSLLSEAHRGLFNQIKREVPEIVAEHLQAANLPGYYLEIDDIVLSYHLGENGPTVSLIGKIKHGVSRLIHGFLLENAPAERAAFKKAVVLQAETFVIRHLAQERETPQRGAVKVGQSQTLLPF